MQCHTAPHTWKLIFESQHRIFELMLSSCSAKEEEEWKALLQERITAENQDLSEGRSTLLDLFALVPADLKPLSAAYGHAESLARRISIQRAATLGPKSQIRQVVIKNTQAQPSPAERNAYQRDSYPVARSQSQLPLSGHVLTLAPRRAERIRLENALSDVWTKDVLPYPGMGTRRPENTIRASANSVIRKLSMASIASNFSRRSTSYASVSTASTTPTLSVDGACSRQSQVRAVRSMAEVGATPDSRARRRLQSKRRENGSASSPTCSHSPVVDFHNAPNAFLPEDFELRGAGRGARKELPASSVQELKRRFAESTRELRPLTPILASGTSSRAEEHHMTIQEALTRPSMMAEGGIENSSPSGIARSRRHDLRDQRTMSRERERRVLMKTPPPMKFEKQFQWRQHSEGTATTSKQAALAATDKKGLKVKSRLFKVLGLEL